MHQKEVFLGQGCSAQIQLHRDSLIASSPSLLLLNLSIDKAPLLSVTTISLHPASCKILTIPYPAEPAPAITTFIASSFLPTILRAFISAANAITAVPC